MPSSSANNASAAPTANSLPSAYSALSLKGKVALITGASSGIGAATARLFAARGALVVVAGRREAEHQTVVDSIISAGGVARFVKADVSIESDAAAAVQKTVEAFGRLDIAVNNAGVFPAYKPLHAHSTAEFTTTHNINVTGVFFGMKYQIQQFLSQQQTIDKERTVDVTSLDHKIQPNDYYLRSHPYVIINTASALGHKGMANGSAYVSSKHAVEGLTRSAALDYAKQGIRVVALDAGYTWTEMTTGFAVENMINSTPIGRIGQANEIAEAAAFLASNAASYITGTGIAVDGGILA